MTDFINMKGFDMKIFVKTKELKNVKPRDIRNLLGSIVDNEFKDEVMWHKRKPPKIIYAKPYKKGFEIINYINDYRLMHHILKKLESIKNNIFLGGKKIKIEDIELKSEDFTIPQPGLYFYQTRTPIILSTNPVEYKIVYATNTQNKKDLIKYIQHRIIHSTKLFAKEYFNIDLDYLDDLNLIIQENDIRLVDYKEGLKKYQAVYLKLASNYSLPRFVGYKIGLGWGELKEKNI